MFNERMTGTELMAEYDKDVDYLQTQSTRFIESDYMNRVLRKHRKEKRVVLTKMMTTPRYNRYIGVFIEECCGVGKSKSWYPSVFQVGLMESHKGLCALVFYEQTGQAIKYIPHFFRRYKERLSAVGDWKTRAQLRAAKTLVDVISLYIRRNLYMAWVETESVFRDKVHIFGPVADGVALLEWDKSKNLLQANTFVTGDMLDDHQNEMVRYAEIYLALSEDERQLIDPPDFVNQSD